MLCNNCKTENTSGVKFCHSCGKPLECSMIDRYPELKLKPTSVYKLPHRPLTVTTIILYILVCGVGFLGLITVWELIGHNRVTLVFGLFCSLVMALLPVVGFDIFKRQNLKAVADYFETTNNKYVFIIKDGKFGLYNRNKRKVQIPCAYTCLQWKPNLKILVATTPEGETFDIDIYNNKLK